MFETVEREHEVLLVEDNPADARLTLEGFREGGLPARLRVVGDGTEAMAVLRREGGHGDAARPSLVLLDLNLPGADGFEILGRLKADPVLQSIPVVVLTSSEAPGDVQRAYSLRANCYVTKPDDLPQFLSVIQSIGEFWLAVVRLPPKGPPAVPGCTNRP